MANCDYAERENLFIIIYATKKLPLTWFSMDRRKLTQNRSLSLAGKQLLNVSHADAASD